MIISERTKMFNKVVETLINKGIAGNYKAIADTIGWTETGLSNARNGRINIPEKYLKSFQEIYKSKNY